MNTSDLVIDLPAWLSWTSDALYVATFCLTLLVIVLVICIVSQIVTTTGHSGAPKRTTHLAQS
jgi:hypothetical protein